MKGFQIMQQQDFVRVILIVLALLAVATGMMAQEATPTGAPALIISEETADNIVDTTVEVADTTATVLENFLNQIVQTPRSTLMQVLFVIGGVALLLAGWRIHNFIILIAGILIGASVALSLTTTENTILLIGVLLIGALIGAFVSSYFYLIALFLVGMYVGIALTSGIATWLTLTPISGFVLLLGGIIGGVVMVALSFEFIVLLSAFIGAQMIVLALGLEPLWTLILTLTGVILQIGMVRYFRFPIRRTPQRTNIFRRVW